MRHSTRTIRLKQASADCQYCMKPILRGEEARRYHGHGQYNPYVHEDCAATMDDVARARAFNGPIAFPNA